MTKIKIKTLSGQNFMSYRDRSLEFGDHTIISGRNRTGKTTVKHLLNWILFDKNAEGKQAVGIRPHDADGKDEDFMDIEGTVVLEVDGREVEIQKVQKQKWVTDRLTKEQKFGGNVNVLYVNGVEKSEKDFKAWLNTVIGEQTYLECSNADVFFGKDTKGRREMLFNRIPTVSNMDVIDSDPEFYEVAEILHAGTPEEVDIDDAIAAVRRRIKGKGRGDRGLEGERDAFPARIDEASKNITDIAEYELGIADMKRKLSELDAQEASLNDATKAYDAKAQEINDLKAKYREIASKASEDLINLRKKKRETLAGLEIDRDDVYSQKVKAEADLKRAEELKESAKVAIQKAKQEYTDLMVKNFDDSEIETIRSEVLSDDSLICPTCGQLLPQERQTEIKAEFEERKLVRIKAIEDKRIDFELNKQAQLSDITQAGEKAKADYESAKVQEESLKELIKELDVKVETLTDKVSVLSKEYDAIPSQVDLSQNKEIRELDAQINQLQDDLVKLGSGSAQRDEIKRERSIADMAIAEYKAKIAQSQGAQDRVDELKAQQKEVAQKIADAMRELDLLDRFNRKKLSMIEERINESFKVIKFRLFEKQVNGEYGPVCQVLVNGTSYDSTLNEGSRRLAEIDLLTAFQRIAGVSVPIFIDNAEGLSDDTVQSIFETIKPACQVIEMRVTEDNMLKIERLS